MAISNNLKNHRAQLPDAEPWVRILGRFGLSALAVVNLAIGILALKLAMGERQQDVSKDSALALVAQQPFGQWILNIVGIGLIAYAVYRVVGAIKDIDAKGTDAKGIVGRIGFAISGIVYGSLGASAVGFAWVSRGSSGSGGGGEGTATQLLEMPFGRILVGAVGVALIGYAIAQIRKGVTKKFFKKFKTVEMSPTVLKTLEVSGMSGLLAKGAVVAIIGGFFLQAAVDETARQSGKLSAALSWIIRQPYGEIMLYAVAIGLILYGVYVALTARYRHFSKTPSAA